jgi:hypothetical protein
LNKTCQENLHTLKLDLDKPTKERAYSLHAQKQQEKEILKRLEMAIKFFQFKIFTIKSSKTKHGKHIMIVFTSPKKITDADIVFLQLLLLSDWKRELFNWLRVRSDCKKWNVLYKQKFNSKGRLVSCEK